MAIKMFRAVDCLGRADYWAEKKGWIAWVGTGWHGEKKALEEDFHIKRVCNIPLFHPGYPRTLFMCFLVQRGKQ